MTRIKPNIFHVTSVMLVSSIYQLTGTWSNRPSVSEVRLGYLLCLHTHAGLHCTPMIAFQLYASEPHKMLCCHYLICASRVCIMVCTAEHNHAACPGQPCSPRPRSSSWPSRARLSPPVVIDDRDRSEALGSNFTTIMCWVP